MSSQATKLTEEFPFSFIIVAFVSGLILLFFSPMRILLPPWIVNPFSMSVADFSAYSFVSIIICSSLLGVPLYLLSQLITGHSGLNEKIADVLYGRRKPRQKDEREIEFDEKIQIGFWKWVEDNKLETTLRHLRNQYALITGLIIGSEASWMFVNWWCIPLLFALGYSVSVFDILTWFSLFPLLIFFFSWFCNKLYFRKYSSYVWRTVKIEFIESLKKEKKKEGDS